MFDDLPPKTMYRVKCGAWRSTCGPDEGPVAGRDQVGTLLALAPNYQPNLPLPNVQGGKHDRHAGSVEKLMSSMAKETLPTALVLPKGKYLNNIWKFKLAFAMKGRGVVLRAMKQGSLLFSKFDLSIKPDLRDLSFL